MRRILLIGALLLPGLAQSEEAAWQPLSGAQISAALNERTLRYTTATQKFYASGKTLYDAGRPSWGNWRVERDQYCSQWPPNTLWACYDLERNGDRLRFVGTRDDITEGQYVDQP